MLTPLQKMPEITDGKKKLTFKNAGYLLLCMLLPTVIMYLIYLARGVHPFGNGCVLVLDLNGQYVWFFEALRKAVYGEPELLYSFSRALGGEFLGIYAYYLASPFSYIVCLFPQTRMLEALLTIFLLKTAICGGTFGYYMHRTLKEPKPFAIIAFSTFYALTSYAVVQQHNTMWIDAVMWLPLITLGIEQMIKHGKYKMYTILLALTLFSNFYIGYMVCIYCLIYFFLYYVAHGGEKGTNNPHHESGHFLKSLFRMAFYSMIAIGIAAVILLSAYYALNFGKTTFSNPKWDWNLKFDILDLLYKFLPGSYDTVRPEGLPFVYCGVLTLLLLPAYFLSSKYPMRQKIVSGVFIFILVASFSLSVVDLIWHGFQKPNWLNYRYSFMLCFYLCVLACRAFAVFETISLKTLMGTGGLIALLCVILQTYSRGEYVDPNDYTCIWFTLIAIFVYLAVLGCLRKTTDRQLVSVILLSVVGFETLLNGLFNINALDEDVTYSRYNYYNDFLNKTRPIVEMVQEKDDSFYRMEKTFFRKTNDNMALEMRGLSGSTSTLNKETIQFLNKMGYASMSHWSKYLGGTPVNDSLLGLKYIISEKDIYENYYEVYAVDEKNGFTAYYNPYALSIAYGVDEDILEFPLGYKPVSTDEEKDKSAIANAIAQVKSKLNQWLGIDETVNNATYVDEYASPFERLNAMVTAMLGEEETVEIFVPIKVKSQDKEMENLEESFVSGPHYSYTPIDENKDATLTYSIEMPETAELFFYLPSDYPREVKLTLDDGGEKTKNMGTFFGNETTRILSLGMQEEGQEISLGMTLTKDHLYVKTREKCFYYIDWAVFEDAMARLAQDQYHITEYTESSFTGTFTASREHQLVMTTIAYDKGWQILVDGKPVETVKTLGSVIGFYVDGEVGETHEVEMVYKPNTFLIGTAVSLISLSLFICLILLDPWMKRRKMLRAVVGIPDYPAPVPKAEDEEEEEELPELILPEEKDVSDLTAAEENPVENPNSLEHLLLASARKCAKSKRTSSPTSENETDAGDKDETATSEKEK